MHLNKAMEEIKQNTKKYLVQKKEEGGKNKTEHRWGKYLVGSIKPQKNIKLH